MTFKEHAFAIRNIVGSEFHSLRLIAHTLDAARAALMEQKLQKKKRLSPSSYQTVCIFLKKAPFEECCQKDLCKTLLKSTKPIPSLFSNHYTVKTLEGTLIDRILPSLIDITKYFEFKTADVYHYISGGYLYIVGNLDLEVVTFQGIFNSSISAYQLECIEPTAEGTCHDYLDKPFPIDADLVLDAYTLTLRTLLPSRINDTKDAYPEYRR